MAGQDRSSNFPNSTGCAPLCRDSSTSDPSPSITSTRYRAIARSGETVSSTAYETHPGGKGLNQSLAAAKAGAAVAHVGCVGGDGDWLAQELANAGVDVSAIRRVAKMPSGHAMIQVTAAGENAIVIDRGANAVVGDAEVDAASALCETDDWIIFQNEIQ